MKKARNKINEKKFKRELKKLCKNLLKYGI
jgi:hypothetical protein